MLVDRVVLGRSRPRTRRTTAYRDRWARAVLESGQPVVPLQPDP